MLEGGGFSNVAVEQNEVIFEFDSPEHFTAYIRAISAPIRAMIEQHAGEAQEEAWDAITQAAAIAGGGSKPLSFSNVVLLASATAQRAPRTIREVDDEPVGRGASAPRPARRLTADSATDSSPSL